MLLLAALGLHCYLRAFSSCSEWRLLSSCGTRASYYRDFSCCRVWAPGYAGSVLVAPRAPTQSRVRLPSPEVQRDSWPRGLGCEGPACAAGPIQRPPLRVCGPWRVPLAPEPEVHPWLQTELVLNLGASALLRAFQKGALFQIGRASCRERV